MTRREKDAIRAMPCGKCGVMPPFGDGSRCHPHRIEPAKGYVTGNVVPRCPDCHALEPGHLPITKYAHRAVVTLNQSLTRAQRQENGRKGAFRMHALYPQLASETMRRTMRENPPNLDQLRKNAVAGARRLHELYPELAREMGRRNGKKYGRKAGLAAAKWRAENTTHEMRSAVAHKAWATKRAKAAPRVAP